MQQCHLIMQTIIRSREKIYFTKIQIIKLNYILCYDIAQPYIFYEILDNLIESKAIFILRLKNLTNHLLFTKKIKWQNNFDF